MVVNTVVMHNRYLHITQSIQRHQPAHPRFFVFQQANMKQKEHEQRVIGYVRDISNFVLLLR